MNFQESLVVFLTALKLTLSRNENNFCCRLWQGVTAVFEIKKKFSYMISYFNVVFLVKMLCINYE